VIWDAVHLWKFFQRRPDWIHIGSQQAEPRVAAIVSLVENPPTTKNPDSSLSLLDLTGLGKLRDQSDRRAYGRFSADSKQTAKVRRRLLMPTTKPVPDAVLSDDIRISRGLVTGLSGQLYHPNG